MIRSNSTLKRKWVLATGWGLTLGIVISFAVHTTWDTLVYKPVHPIILATLAGVVIGIGQCMVLKYPFKRSVWYVLGNAAGFAGGMALAITIGIAGATGRGMFSRGGLISSETINAAGVGSGLVFVLAVTLTSGLFGVVAGFVIGVFQWLSGARQFSRADRWIIFSGIGWAASLAIGGVVVALLNVLAGGTLRYVVESPSFLVILFREGYARYVAAMILAVGLIAHISGRIAGSITGKAFIDHTGSDNEEESPSRFFSLAQGWRRISAWQKLSSFIGAIILTLGVCSAVYLLSGELGARLLDYISWEELSGGPCSDIDLEISTNPRVMTEKDSQALSAQVTNRANVECTVKFQIKAPAFVVDPAHDTSRTFSVPGGGTATMTWVISPKQMGTHAIAIEVGRQATVLSFTVTSILGLTAQQMQILTYVGTFLGSTLTLPWLYNVWQERRKDKQEKREIEHLRQQIEELKAQQKSKRRWLFWK